MTATQPLGTYKKGEIPLDIQHTFEEFDGTPVNLAGFTIKVNTTSPSGVSADYNATNTTPASGIVTVAWSAAMTGEVGPWSLHIWCSNGTKLLTSPTFAYNVTYADAPSFS